MPEPYPELESKLRPLTDPLPRPRPGDWLAEHDEPGQTFAEYLEARPVRRSDKLHTIYLCLVGDFTEAQRRILALTRDFSCLMNGSNHQEEKDRRPMHLCPVCLRKLCWNLRVEPVPYLMKLKAFCQQHGLDPESARYEQALAALAG